MTIGTDKPTQEEVGSVPFYFFDEYAPDHPISVYDFQQKLRPLLDRFEKEGQDVLVVGGTFLYIKALLFNYVFAKDSPSTPEEDELPLAKLQQRLLQLSPSVYSQIDVQNPRRVIRAIRQLEEGNNREDILKKNDGSPLYPTCFVCIDVDKEEGNRLIDERVDRMFKQGFEAEVQKLLRKYPSNLRPFSSIGYKEVVDAIMQNQPIDDSVKDLIKVHTHQYAKKQRTFLKNQFQNVHHGTKEEIYSFLRKNILSHQKENPLH